MDRYFYRDMVVPYRKGAREYRVFDRRRGAVDDDYALATCTDHEVAQRITDLLNANEVRKAKPANKPAATAAWDLAERAAKGQTNL